MLCAKADIIINLLSALQKLQIGRLIGLARWRFYEAAVVEKLGQAGNSSDQIRAYIGLGSNEGDRVGFVQQAMQLLKDIPRIKIVECSSLYETEPVGSQYTEWFVNAVAALDTNLTVEELLDVCRDVESRLIEFYGNETSGCLPNQSCGKSRIIDLDILFYGQEIVNTSNLTVPHPSLHQRAFALVPLLEIAPDVIHPGLKATVQELHEALPEPELVYLYGTRGLDSEFL